MAICIAPLTTTVMSSASQEQAGVASGVNNAVSRIAGLLAVAALGLVLYGTFNRALDRRLATLRLSPSELNQVNEQRPRLAAMEIDDPRVTREIAESFVAGYKTILGIAIALALASALTARFMLDPQKPT
jgi:hypothetical protein